MSRRRTGRAGGRRKRGIFVEGGWLSEWQPKNRKNPERSHSAPGNSSSRIRALPSSSSSAADESDGSSISSDFAKDYVSNFGPDCSLHSELAPASRFLEHNELDYMEEDSTDSGDSEAESDIELAGRAPFGADVDSGYYTSEDEDSRSCCSIHKEEIRLQSLQIGEQFVDEMVEAFVTPIPESSRHAPASSARTYWQKGVPGEKKRHRKEIIAAKRRERALHRGVDLQAISLMFEDMVLKEGDMLALEPMKSKDRALVHKLASAYRLKTGSQGSGKKRFVVVTRTVHTCMPRGTNREQLMKLLGEGLRTPPASSTRSRGGEAARLAKKYQRVARDAMRAASQEEQRDKKKNKAVILDEGARRKRCRSSGGKAAAGQVKQSQPLNFVARGTIPEVGEQQPASTSSSAATPRIELVAAFGQFEAHTKGFGSRMLARMGFVEGTGLGREGQGMTQPLQASRRPKSLGLGANTQ